MAVDAPFLASEAWLKARAGRTDGEVFTFVAGDPPAGIYGTLITSPKVDEVFNLRALLSSWPRTIMPDPRFDEARRELARELPPTDQWFPNLAVGYPGYECFPVGPGAVMVESVETLVAGIAGWSAERDLTCASFLYTSPSENCLNAVLGRQAIARAHLTYTCDLELPGEHFEDYLAALPKHARTEARREMRQIERAGLQTKEIELSSVFDSVIQLRLRHAAKYGRNSSKEKETRKLDSLISHFGDSSLTLFGATLSSELVAFTLFLKYGGEWYALDSGSSYSGDVVRFTYFDTAFYTPVRYAYETGLRKIHYSMAAWDAKRRRGCSLVPREAWIKPLKESLVPASQKAAKLLKPPSDR